MRVRTTSLALAGEASEVAEGGRRPERRGAVVAIGRVRARQFRRRAELARLVAWRRRYGVDLGAPQDWAAIIADLSIYSRHGLDYLSFVEIATALGIEIPERTAMAAIHHLAAIADRKGRSYRPIRGETIAEWLFVTADERIELKLRTIGATNETAEERKYRLAVDRRKRDAERKRRARAAAGSKQRPKYEAESVSRQKPWETEGISRRTWYRRRQSEQDGTGVSAHISIEDCVGTDMCHPRILQSVNPDGAGSRPTVEAAAGERSEAPPARSAAAMPRLAFVSGSTE